jgi:hypothetical protein
MILGGAEMPFDQLDPVSEGGKFLREISQIADQI